MLWCISSVLPMSELFFSQLTFVFPSPRTLSGLLKHRLQVLRNLLGLLGASYSPCLLALFFPQVSLVVTGKLTNCSTIW